MASTAAGGRRTVTPSELSFQTLVAFFEGCKRIKKNRQDYVKKFIQYNIDKSSHDGYSVFRLVLPQLDRARGNYKLLESKLSEVMLRAAGMDKKSREASVIEKWKRPGSKAAGDFAAVLKDTIFNDRCMIDPGGDPARLKTLKVGRLNEDLDRLAAHAGNTAEQAIILRGLIQITTPDQMAWIVQIILKNLKINAGEGTIFSAWHPDAEQYYNNSGMDLAFVFNQMTDTHRRYNTSMQPGVPVRPQLALASNSVRWAFNRMHDQDGALREFVVEVKFDGERIQVHRTAAGDISYYSRRAIEHAEKSSYDVADEIIQRHTKGTCILDGEMVVWNKKRQCFETFGSIKPLVTAIRDKKSAVDVLEYNEVDEDHAAVVDADYEAPLIGHCELWYIAFDILHNGDSGVNELPLRERQRMLEAAVLPGEARPLAGSAVCGRMVPLLPGKTHIGGMLASRLGKGEEDISSMLAEMARIREEGIVVKALDSQWHPNERFSNSWIKIKPDYVKGIELDCVAIGAWGGKGGRGGLYTQYLLALADPSASTSSAPSSYTSFCRVGSGLNETERERVHQQITPLCVEADGRSPPSIYNITGREKPDVWITDPEKSVVFKVQADLRTIRSKQFATGYSLRFPIIQAIRDDKAGSMASTTRELQELVDQQRQKADVEMGAPSQVADDGKKRKRGTRRERPAKRPKGSLQVVPAARPTDLSQVDVESNALEGCHIVFANYGDYNKKEVEQVVKQLGGEVRVLFTANSGITHILAGDESGTKVKGHISQDRDVVSIAWLLECRLQGRRVPLRPRYFIHRSSASLVADPTNVDSMGDSYWEDVDEADVTTLLRRTVRPGLVNPSMLAAKLAEESEFEGDEDERVKQAQHQLGKLHDGQDASHALAAYLDAQLATIGREDPRFSCLRSCCILVLRLGTGRAPWPNPHCGSNVQRFPSVQSIVQQAAALQARLQQQQASGIGAEARVLGARVARNLGSPVTHAVGLTLPHRQQTPPSAGLSAAAVEPDTLLRAVSEQAGGAPAVATLKLKLATGGVHLVTDSWLHSCLETAQLASEAGYALDVAHADNLDSWPWEPFVPKLSPRMAASSEGRQGPSPTHAATRASRGRAALTAATSSQRPRGAPRAAAKAGEQGSQAAPGRDGGVSSRLVVRPPGRGMRVGRRAAMKQEDVDEAAIAVKPEEAEDPALVAVEALVPAQHTTEPSLQKAGTAAAAAAEDTQHTALGSPIGAQQLSGEQNGGGAPPPQALMFDVLFPNLGTRAGGPPAVPSPPAPIHSAANQPAPATASQKPAAVHGARGSPNAERLQAAARHAAAEAAKDDSVPVARMSLRERMRLLTQNKERE